MSWFWGKKKDEDPTKSLDSDLKQFLDSQQPKTYTPTPAAPIPEDKSLRAQSSPANKSDEEEFQLPKESLYQDGRYKDLWKTYVPHSRIEGQVVTPVQRIIDAKKDRKASLTQAALQNCAFEEELKRTCYMEGDAYNKLRGRFTLCNRETKAFNRCFTLQAKFLQALGYRGNLTSSDDEDEVIQMHADKLYHRMMDYEAAVEDAKANGTPIPPLTSVFNSARPAPTLEELNLPDNLRRTLNKPIQQLPPQERELAARALLQETKVSQEFAEDFFAYTTTLNEGRKDRQKKLVNAFGDTLGKFFIPDAPDESEVPKIDPKVYERDIWKDDPKPGKG